MNCLWWWPRVGRPYPVLAELLEAFGSAGAAVYTVAGYRTGRARWARTGVAAGRSDRCPGAHRSSGPDRGPAEPLSTPPGDLNGFPGRILPAGTEAIEPSHCESLDAVTRALKTTCSGATMATCQHVEASGPAAVTQPT